MSDGAIFTKYLLDENSKKIRDHLDRSALMASAIAGNILGAMHLLENGWDFNYVSKYGDSAIFFAMKYSRWNWLKEIRRWSITLSLEKKESTGTEIVPPYVVLKDDKSSRQLLIHK